MEKRFALDAEKLPWEVRWIDGERNRDVSRISVRVHVRTAEKFLNFSLLDGWDGRRKIPWLARNETNFLTLALLFPSTMKTTRRGEREKEEWKKEESGVGSSSAAKRKIGNILRSDDGRHRAGDGASPTSLCFIPENDYRSSLRLLRDKNWNFLMKERRKNSFFKSVFE